jgi:hypothetical protein
LPRPVISGPASGCGQVTLSTGAFASYQWYLNGNWMDWTGQSVEATESGVYSVVVMDSNGCQGTSQDFSLTITLNPVPTIRTDAIRERFWATNGTVYAVEESNGVIYLGGEFSQVGPYIGGAAVLDGITGQVEVAFPHLDATMTCATSDNSGGSYIAMHNATTNLSRVYHVLADGSVDNEMLAYATGRIYAMVLANSILFLGGEITLTILLELMLSLATWRSGIIT